MPPQIYPYDRTTDLDEPIKNIEAIIDYRNFWGAVQCRLFATTLQKGAINMVKKSENKVHLLGMKYADKSMHHEDNPRRLQPWKASS